MRLIRKFMLIKTNFKILILSISFLRKLYHVFVFVMFQTFCKQTNRNIGALEIRNIRNRQFIVCVTEQHYVSIFFTRLWSVRKSLLFDTQNPERSVVLLRRQVIHHGMTSR